MVLDEASLAKVLRIVKIIQKYELTRNVANMNSLQFCRIYLCWYLTHPFDLIDPEWLLVFDLETTLQAH